MATWTDFQKSLHAARTEGGFTLNDAQMQVLNKSVLQYYRDQYKVALFDHDGDEIDEQGNKLKPASHLSQ